jgi:hypothetical protein
VFRGYDQSSRTPSPLHCPHPSQESGGPCIQLTVLAIKVEAKSFLCLIELYIGIEALVGDVSHGLAVFVPPRHVPAVCLIHLADQ